MFRPLTLFLILMICAAPARAVVVCDLVPAEEILLASTHGDGSLTFTSRDGFRVPLLMGPDGLDIDNPAYHGQLYPIEPRQVRAALAELSEWNGPALAVTVYCLPGYPAAVGRSFAVGNEIFLAPGFDGVRDEVVAYTVVHELGHVVHNDRALRIPGAWLEYLELREITDRHIYHSSATHRDRPREIFAEDFRALFGGPLATYSGTIENPGLPHPDHVVGLTDLVTKLLETPRPADTGSSVTNVPNPFNPNTTIVVSLGSAIPHSLTIDIVDLRGRVVRHLGVRDAASEVRVEWDGTNAAGRNVASGQYFARVRAGRQVLTRPMLLVK